MTNAQLFGDLVSNWNFAEAGLWLITGLILLIKAFTVERRLRAVLLMLAAAFLVFSASDVIEAYTGAWWQPIGLLFMKASCLIVFVLGFWKYYRLTKK